MDNLTHSLAGALLGQAGLKRKTGLAMPALIIGANLPDVDAACFAWLDGMEHLAFRRGITHGPPALILLPLILAGALWAYDRWQAKRGTRPDARLPVRFGWLYALAFIGCLSHPALDWMNVYGIRLLEPFSSRWFYGDVLFIIDLWLWLGMGIAVWLSLKRERSGGDWRRVGRIALAGVLAYIGLNAAITHWRESGALGEAPYPRIAIASPVPLAFWDRQMITWEGADLWRVDGRVVSECDALAAVNRAGDNADLEAFKFWSRAPIAMRAEDGSVLIRDARYADSLSNRGFTVPLGDIPCEPAGG